MRTNKKATKLCDMRKTHWWDHSTITNKTFDCLICDQGQGRAKRVFTLIFISQVLLLSSVMKKRRILLRISLKSAHLYDDEKVAFERGGGGVFGRSLNFCSFEGTQIGATGHRSSKTPTMPHFHLTISYTSINSICFLLFSFYVMTSLATTVHISKQPYHIESPMATSWRIHSAYNFGMVHLTLVKYTDIL